MHASKAYLYRCFIVIGRTVAIERGAVVDEPTVSSEEQIPGATSRYPFMIFPALSQALLLCFFNCIDTLWLL